MFFQTVNFKNYSDIAHITHIHWVHLRRIHRQSMHTWHPHILIAKWIIHIHIWHMRIYWIYIRHGKLRTLKRRHIWSVLIILFLIKIVIVSSIFLLRFLFIYINSKRCIFVRLFIIFSIFISKKMFLFIFFFLWLNLWNLIIKSIILHQY